jgi:hypothetical protein
MEGAGSKVRVRLFRKFDRSLLWKLSFQKKGEDYSMHFNWEQEDPAMKELDRQIVAAEEHTKATQNNEKFANRDRGKVGRLLA